METVNAVTRPKLGRYVLEATPKGTDLWRPAAAWFPCPVSHPSRRTAEAELEVHREQARFRVLDLRVRCEEPDELEAAREAKARAPGADGKGPVTLVPPRPAPVAPPRKGKK